MSEKDIELIEWAEKLNCIDWSLIDPDKAESEEAREKLHRIQVRKYKQEENW